MSQRLTAIFATRHEVFLDDLCPTVFPKNAFTGIAREKRFGVLWGLELCELSATKVPNTGLDMFGLGSRVRRSSSIYNPGRGWFRSNLGVVDDSCLNRRGSQRRHGVVRQNDSFQTL